MSKKTELTPWSAAKQYLIDKLGLSNYAFKKYTPIWVERGWLTRLPQSKNFAFANLDKIENYLKGN